MKWQYRKNRIHPDSSREYLNRSHENNVSDESITRSVADYIKFIFFCMLLIIPVYAIAKSAIKHDWIMMIIDALLVPVGFVHGVLLFFGYVN